jgi:site-specific DNA-methyltransferase (adenine-specific)
MTPYYSDETVTLYHGDMREVLTLLGRGTYFDCAVTDPPYGETTLTWDRWPDGWPTIAAEHTNSMWCFGSMRMFLDRRDEFADWKLSQDVVWEKHNGSSFVADRFKRVHEVATHWYRGEWRRVHHEVPRTAHHGPSKDWRPSGKPQAARSEHTGQIGARGGYADDGTRMARSVLTVPSMQQRAQHPTEKPVGILDPLIRYACPPGGTVLDPFAGSGSTAVAARMSGRRAVLIEADERYCEAIANRVQQDVLPLGATS